MKKLSDNTCKTCGSRFKTVKPQLFCCAECYHDWQRTDEVRNQRRPKAVCQFCGKEFYADGRFAGRERKFCSKKCANQHKAKATPYSNWITKTCPTCGEVFQVKQTSKNRIYCSKDCYSKAQIQYTEGRRVGDRQTARRRRERLKEPIMPHYLEALEIVQGDRCAFCGKPLLGHGTIEHLLPVSAGGTNKWSNIVLVCKSCNSRKGYKRLSDYALENDLLEILDRTILIAYYAKKLAEKLTQNKNGKR